MKIGLHMLPKSIHEIKPLLHDVDGIYIVKNRRGNFVKDMIEFVLKTGSFMNIAQGDEHLFKNAKRNAMNFLTFSPKVVGNRLPLLTYCSSSLIIKYTNSC